MQLVTPRLKYYNANNIHQAHQYTQIPKEHRAALPLLAQVFPFRVNNYVLDRLIDWSNVPSDPVFKLSFLDPSFLTDRQYEWLRSCQEGSEQRHSAIAQIRRELNPHPSNQVEGNSVIHQGRKIPGIQHKYKETLLIFPGAGQTCFTYCSFCFRWPQFVKQPDMRFATQAQQPYLDYIADHKELSDVLFTGGDPMVMNFRRLHQLFSPLLESAFDHIQNIRIGTKVLTFWPFRFINDPDSDSILRLFEHLNRSGKRVSIMAHFNHWRELSTPECQLAIQQILATGTTIRCQSPLLKGINDDAEVWQRMWKQQVKHGMIPYYMFVERDTGPKDFFEIPLHKAFNIFKNAYQRSSGLAKTVRGPSMSADPGKIAIEGIGEYFGQHCFQLKFMQARHPDWCNQLFFAQYDESATWLNDLKPAFGEKSFFFESHSNLTQGNHCSAIPTTALEPSL